MTTPRQFMAIALIGVLAAPALADETEHRLGAHPAVIVQRLKAKQPYDYAAKFYPHPAWLFLRGEATPPDSLSREGASAALAASPIFPTPGPVAPTAPGT